MRHKYLRNDFIGCTSFLSCSSEGENYFLIINVKPVNKKILPNITNADALTINIAV